MHPRVRAAVTVAVICATAIVGIAIAVGRTAGSSGGPTLTKTKGFYGFALPPSFPAVEFALPDQNGKVVRLSSYAGQVVAATFIYSTCASTCPIVVEQLKNALNQLPKRVPALAISVDPTQDTTQNVDAFLVKQQVVGVLRYLVAPRATLAPIWKTFGVEPQRAVKSSNSDHSIDLVIFDKTGRARVGYTDLTTMDPDAIAADIRTLQQQPLPPALPRRKQI
jgi:protein SCO1/2